MATMKNHSFGFNVEDPVQKAAHDFCESMKLKKELSGYIRRLILADMKKSGLNKTGSLTGLSIPQRRKNESGNLNVTNGKSSFKQ